MNETCETWAQCPLDWQDHLICADVADITHHSHTPHHFSGKSHTYIRGYILYLIECTIMANIVYRYIYSIIYLYLHSSETHKVLSWNPLDGKMMRSVLTH